MNEEEREAIEKAEKVNSLLLSIYGEDGEFAGSGRVKEFCELNEAIKKLHQKGGAIRA